MDVDTTNRLFCIICISCVPVVGLLILFSLLVIATSRHRTIDIVTCSLLLGRLGHACAVVVMMSVYTLENWPWGKSACQAFVWMWVSFWTLDLFTNILFLLYNSLRVGQSKDNTRCHMVLMTLTSWGLAILTGAFTFMTDWMFNNLSETGEGCYLGLSNGEQPIRVAAMFVIIIGGLLIIVLTITISAESRAQSLKYKLEHPDVIHATNSTKQISIRQNGELLHRDPTEVYQIIDITSETPEITSNGHSPTHDLTPNGTAASYTQRDRDNGVTSDTSNDTSTNNYSSNNNSANISESNNANNNNSLAAPGLESENVRTWRYIDRQMRDLRHLHGAATSCTVLLNLLPQLILYSMDSVSGSPYTYGHHILVTAGLVHALVLPVTFCTSGLRYRGVATRLVRDACRTKNTTPQPEGPRVEEEKLVFHIRDVTLTETSDMAPEVAASTDRPASAYSKARVVRVHGESTQEANSQPNGRGSTITTEADISPVPVAVLTSDRGGTLRGTVNPGYEDTEQECRPVYSRSQSDGVVDYYSDDGSWDSDSETWSNLYDESDIDEVLYDGMIVGSLKSNRLSPNTLTKGRRNSTLPNGAELHHRRKLSRQISTPLEGSPHRTRRKSVDEDSRRRRKKSRHRRRASRDLVGDLAPMMQLGIASAVIAKNTNDNQNNMNSASENINDTRGVSPEPVDGNTFNQEVQYAQEQCEPYCGSQLNDQPQTSRQSWDTQDNPVAKKVSFGSELAATANRFRKSYDEQETKKVEQLKMNELVQKSRKTRVAKKIVRNSSSSYVNGRQSATQQGEAQIPVAPPLPEYLFSNDPPPKPPRVPDNSASGVSQTNNKMTNVDKKAKESTKRRGSNLSDKLKKSILRHKSSFQSSRQSSMKLQTPTTANVRASAPEPQLASPQTHDMEKRQSLPPQVDPALSGMTLDKILKNPFLTDMLRQSLESLDSTGKDDVIANTSSELDDTSQDKTSNAGQKEQSTTPNPFLTMLSQEPAADAVTSHNADEHNTPEPSSNFVSKARENVLYEIPTIDADHRYRQRKPIRRGLYAFRAAARAVAISGFLKKSNNNTESNEMNGNGAISDFINKSRDKTQGSDLERNSSSSGSFSVSSDLHYI